MHLIDRIGPYLGVAAFLALAVLAALVIIEAREVRRLREWAGRAPERAVEAAEATSAAAAAKGEPGEAKPGFLKRIAGAFAAWRAGIAERFGPAYEEVDRRSPVDPRIVLGVLVAAVVAAGVLTNGFGLGGGGGGSHGKTRSATSPSKLKVAVLNGSQEQGVAGVPGLAETVFTKVVKPAGYKTGAVTDAPRSYSKSVVLFAKGEQMDATALAKVAGGKLGAMKTRPMNSDVSAVVGKDQLALVIGVDDKSFGTSGP
jgi:hypothetical protein